MRKLIVLLLCALIAIAHSQAHGSSSWKKKIQLVDQKFPGKKSIFMSMGRLIKNIGSRKVYLQPAIITNGRNELSAYQGYKRDKLNLDHQGTTNYSVYFSNGKSYEVMSILDNLYPVTMINLQNQPELRYTDKLEFRRPYVYDTQVIIATWNKDNKLLMIMSRIMTWNPHYIDVSLEKAKVVYGHEDASVRDIKKGDILLQGVALLGFLDRINRKRSIASFYYIDAEIAEQMDKLRPSHNIQPHEDYDYPEK